MTELKTLNEILSKRMSSAGQIQQSRPLTPMQREQTIKKLKKEAIKWVKHYEKLNEKEGVVNSNEMAGNFILIVWIKHFFNITDEDLKND